MNYEPRLEPDLDLSSRGLPDIWPHPRRVVAGRPGSALLETLDLAPLQVAFRRPGRDSMCWLIMLNG